MKLIILDRDGVINEDTNYIKSPEEWLPIPGSLEAIRDFNHAGFKVVVATNQSGIARGYFTESDLQDIHATMQSALAQLDARIDGIFYCPHGPDENCSCRKPRPGLFERIAQTYAVSLQNVMAVGDSLRDLQAAKAAGATPILVLTGKGQKTWQQHHSEIDGVASYENLSSFSQHFLSKEQPHV